MIDNIPASTTAVVGSLVTIRGVMAARIIGETEESGPRTNTLDGPKIAYPTRQATVV